MSRNSPPPSCRNTFQPLSQARPVRIAPPHPPSCRLDVVNFFFPYAAPDPDIIQLTFFRKAASPLTLHRGKTCSQFPSGDHSPRSKCSAFQVARTHSLFPGGSSLTLHHCHLTGLGPRSLGPYQTIRNMRHATRKSFVPFRSYAPLAPHLFSCSWACRSVPMFLDPSRQGGSSLFVASIVLNFPSPIEDAFSIYDAILHFFSC